MLSTLIILKLKVNFCCKTVLYEFAFEDKEPVCKIKKKIIQKNLFWSENAGTGVYLSETCSRLSMHSRNYSWDIKIMKKFIKFEKTLWTCISRCGNNCISAKVASNGLDLQIEPSFEYSRFDPNGTISQKSCFCKF